MDWKRTLHQRYNMDEFYDLVKAKDTIQKLSEESTKSNKYHLSRIIKEGLQMMNVSLQKDDNDFVWRLIKGGAEETEEIVFACTGVICEVDLPPVIRSPGYVFVLVGRDKTITLSQSVTLTGLGCVAFDETIATLQEIRLTGEREFKNGMLEKWTPLTYRGFPAFSISNRYFRMAKEGGQYEAIEFSKDVDPVGILQRLGKTDVAHTEDNEVQYFKANVDDEGKRRFQRARPQLFRIGDIVKVQCLVIMFKVKGAKHRMKLVLRAIAMLDCNMTLDAKRMSSKCLAPEDTGPKQLKRKIGFTDEESCEDVAAKRAKEGPTMDETA
ncbi:hypothetical protein IW261DRAFT_1562162 [Armillaria novae-zelandiae]|uniref:Uncharacterized protein n=1 Tax=Armillaria novae-zelandiae TaxID=153914 RepID=A0AA39UH86_9AGAR|nr:hypothetical protein IW261DRAFT_1562162 [Armillaria novae-zelandiae]